MFVICKQNSDMYKFFNYAYFTVLDGMFEAHVLYLHLLWM